MITKRQSWRRESFSADEFDENENTPIIHKVTSTTRKKSYKKWTKEEDDRLREFMNSHSNAQDWSNVSKFVGNGRTDAQCQHRWERFLDPSITKGPWTDDEDKKVIELVRDYGARQWSLIAKELKGRVGKQCRERWHNHLNPMINKNPWTNEENLRLFILHQHFGNKWAEIAKYFNGRSDNSIKNHWNSSMKKKFQCEVENLKKQGLDWTALIPPDFSWPKFDQSLSNKTRTPLGTITNQTSTKRLSISKKNLLSPLSVIKSENYLPNQNSINNENHFESISTDLLFNQSTDDFEHLLFDSSSFAHSQTSSSSSYLPVFTCSSSPHLSLLSDDDLFLFKTNENLLLSPSKYHVLNTPEKTTQFIRTSPSPKRDCFNEYLPFPEPVLAEYYSSIRFDKYDITKNLEEKLGYHPTYTEILIGQTRDQRYITEQARRYLSL